MQRTLPEHPRLTSGMRMARPRWYLTSQLEAVQLVVQGGNEKDHRERTNQLHLQNANLHPTSCVAVIALIA